MSEELKALERVRKAPTSYREEKPRFTHIYFEDLELIKTALERLEEQDSIIKTLKEVIAFARKLPDIEIDEDGDFQAMIGTVGMKIQRQMDNKERELLRNWVLKTCFPKELKAVEIIKEKRVNVWCLLNVGLERYNKEFVFSEERRLTQEDFDLLKEVLKCN